MIALISMVCGHLPSTTYWLRASKKKGVIIRGTGGGGMQTTRSMAMANRERETRAVHGYSACVPAVCEIGGNRRKPPAGGTDGGCHGCKPARDILSASRAWHLESVIHLGTAMVPWQHTSHMVMCAHAGV